MGFLNSLGPTAHLWNGALALHCCQVLGSAPTPPVPALQRHAPCSAHGAKAVWAGATGRRRLCC